MYIYIYRYIQSYLKTLLKWETAWGGFCLKHQVWMVSRGYDVVGAAGTVKNLKIPWDKLVSQVQRDGYCVNGKTLG